MGLMQLATPIKILGCGTSLPPGPAVTNLDLLRHDPDHAAQSQAYLEKFAERIGRQFGFQRRYLSRMPLAAEAPEEATAESLALAAVRQAVGEKLPAALLLGCTTSARYAGSQACAVLGAIGAVAPALEMKAGCSTSLATLHCALGWLRMGYPDVLISCAETLSKVMHPSVKETWFGLADAGAALWLAPSDAASADATIEQSYFKTDGRHVDLYTTRGQLPPTKAALEAGGYVLQGDGAKLRELGALRYREIIDTLLPSAAARAQITRIIPHQVNRGLIDEVVAAAGLTAPLLWDAGEIGNVGGTSVLYTLAKAWTAGTIQPGDRVLFMSVGGGLSFAGQVWQVHKRGGSKA